MAWKNLADSSAYYGVNSKDPNDPADIQVTDPTTGKTFNTNSLGVGAGAAAADVAHGFALDTSFNTGKAQGIAGFNSLLGDPALAQFQNSITSAMTNPFLDEKYARNSVSLGADQAGQQGLALSRNAANSLASRGINPNSGIAAGIGFGITATNIGAVRSAQLNAETQALGMMAQQRALAFQAQSNVLGYKAGIQSNLANLETAEPGFGTKAIEGLSSAELQNHWIDKMYQQGKKQASNNLLGGLLGAGGSILSSVLGAAL